MHEFFSECEIKVIYNIPEEADMLFMNQDVFVNFDIDDFIKRNPVAIDLLISALEMKCNFSNEVYLYLYEKTLYLEGLHDFYYAIDLPNWLLSIIVKYRIMKGENRNA